MSKSPILKQTIIELLAEEGQLSTNDIISELKNRVGKDSERYKIRAPQTIRDAIKEMSENKNPLIELVREKQSIRGKHEKFYSLTLEGVKWHLIQNASTLKDFWKMVVIHSDIRLDKFIRTEFKPKRIKNFPTFDDQKIIEENNRKFPIDILELIKFYEEEILHVYRDYFYSHNIRNVLNHFRYSTDEDLVFYDDAFPILEILALNSHQNYAEIMIKLLEYEENVEEKYGPILDLMFKKGLIFSWDGRFVNTYSLSILGILLVFDLWNQKYLDKNKKNALWFKRRIAEIENREEKTSTLNGFKTIHPELYKLIIEPETANEKLFKVKIDKVVKNYANIFPIIFSDNTWKKINQHIDSIELVNTLVNPYFENTEMSEGAYDQKNDLLLQHSIEGIRRIYSLELQRLFRTGLGICSGFANGHHCKIPIMTDTGLLSEETIFLLYASQEDYMKFAEMKSYSRNDLAIFYFFLWKSLLILHQLQIKLSKSNSIEFESKFNSIDDYNQKSSGKSVVNVISFEFLNQLKIHNPINFKNIIKNDSLREFYKNWLNKISDFDNIERTYQLN